MSDEKTVDLIEECAGYIDNEDLTYAQYKSANGCYVCINTITGRIIGTKCGGTPFKNIRIVRVK